MCSWQAEGLRALRPRWRLGAQARAFRLDAVSDTLHKALDAARA